MRCASNSRGETGSALVEFITVGVAALIPISVLLTGIFTVQRASVAAQSAVREATRAFVLSVDEGQAFVAAQTAADVILSDAGLGPVKLHIACSEASCLSPSSEVRISMDFPVRTAGKVFQVKAHHQESVDPWT